MSPHRFILILFFVVSTTTGFSQAATTNTLLWRISGNALTRPSYLFGTMHVTDKKAFQFQDSLYRFLEEVDAFAMEVHPDSMTAVIAEYLNRDTEEEIDWDKVLGKEELKQLEKELNKSTQKLPAGSRNRKLKFLLTKLMNADKPLTDAMDTFMDAYLYEVARRNAKEIHGLEQVADQLVALSVLPRGIQVANFLKLLEKWNPAMASPIHELYYKEDIEQMEGFYRNMFTDSVLHIFLYNRNAVMVQKMDSLMKGKSLFTAVGAGHLAGTKGVITLLRQKGYKVEPVFSANRIKAADYKLKEAAHSWPVQQNSLHGFAYSMPAAPKVQAGQNGSEVALHFDMGNGLTYMVVSGLMSVEEKLSGLAAAQKHLDQFMIKTAAALISLDTVMVNNKPTLEALCKAKDNSHFRFREMTDGFMFYIFTLSGRNKEALFGNSASQYFSSYKTLAPANAVWQKARYADAGFEVALPVPFKVEDTKLDADAANKIAWRTYNALDYRTAINYTLYSCKALAGNELLDNYFFEHFINNLTENTGGGDVEIRDTVIGGFPAKRFVTAPYNGIIVKGLIIERLNHCYYLSAEYSNPTASADADRFLASFALVPFAPAAWQQVADSDNRFTMWAPGSIQLLAADEEDEEAEEKTTFYTYDTGNAENYMVSRNQLSKYLWAENIDSVYNYWINQNISNYTDTILRNEPVVNGGLPARALLLQNKKTGIQSKVRLVLDGNEMYELTAVLPPDADTANVNRLLQSFTVNYPQKEMPVLFNHPGLLFMDLQLENDAYFTNAYGAIERMPFTAKELPLLLQQSLQVFPITADGYESVNIKLLYKLYNVLVNMPGGKDSLVQFVKQHYHHLDTAVQHVQYTMLDLLAEDDRPATYALINDLLKQKPAPAYHYSFFYTLNNKPRAAASLFPLLYQYAEDSTIGASVLMLANNLADSGYLATESLKAQKNQWVQLLNAHLKRTLKNEDADVIVFSLIELAGKLNLPEVNAVLAKYIAAKDKWVKFDAVAALLKNGLPIPAAAIQSLAADKYFRAGLYSKLKEAKKLSLFPAAYRTQKSMAESYIYRALKDEEEVEGETQMIYIKTIEQLYKGEKRRFFLFRVNMDESEESGNEDPSSFLSVAGPFSLEATQIAIEDNDNISGTYYESNFDGMKLDVLFKKYMQPFIKRKAD